MKLVLIGLVVASAATSVTRAQGPLPLPARGPGNEPTNGMPFTLRPPTIPTIGIHSVGGLTLKPRPQQRVTYRPAAFPYVPYYPAAYQMDTPDTYVNSYNNYNYFDQSSAVLNLFAPPVVTPYADPYAASEQNRQNAEGAIGTLDPDRSRVQPAEADDVKSVEAIVGAMYDVLSGPRGTPRNWDRFRSLFADGARMIATRTESNGTSRPAVMTADDYAQIAAPVLERGVFQREVSHTIEKFGSIAHVFSTYECRRTSGDAAPYQRGINSIELMNDGTRWWVTAVSWDSERSDNPIPAKYLPAPVKKP